MQHEIRLQPSLKDLATLPGEIEAFAERNELSAADAMCLALAAEELFTNTVRHGNSSEPIHLSLARAGNIVRLTYSDAGPEFDPRVELPPPLSGAAEERPVGGLGLHMIRSTMDAIRYERRDGRNIVTLERTLGRAKLAL